VIFFLHASFKKITRDFHGKITRLVKKFLRFFISADFFFFNNNSAVCEIITREITGFYLVIFRFLLVVVVKSREIVNFS